ncbi:hypothetical protein MSL71_11140 [Desulfoluna butyratoxydans]|uniref:Uncharacterized protein n=1 Tax=Desulfoluna butyratoxydans TaxID=231438 RepID=A0A4U8YK60_9BACT|nr:hypothetical protein MSL71_11140 [Desulfoluna butyratoxydans]
MDNTGIDKWNQMHPVKTPVSVGRKTATVTRSGAFVSGKGKSMVWLEGFAFPVELTKVRAL